MNGKTWTVIGVCAAAVLIASFLFFVDFNGLFQKSEPVSALPVETPKPSEEPFLQENVTLYFGADEGKFLTAEERVVSVKSRDELPVQVVKELIAGPKTPALSPVFHTGTVLLGVTVEGKTATADFTDSLLSFNTGGTTRETLCVYSVVNSLCELPEIERVRFSVNGKVISTFGQFDLSEPYEKYLDIVKKNK